MSLHSISMRLYRGIKTVPFVGRAARLCVSYLKIAFASWHYSQNRLSSDLFPEQVDVPARAVVLTDPRAEAARLSRALDSRSEGRTGDRVLVEAVDGHGVASTFHWDVGLRLHRFLPNGGASRLSFALEADWLGEASLEALAEAIGPLGLLSMRFMDPGLALARPGADMAAIKRAEGFVNGERIAVRLRARGLEVVLSPVEGGFTLLEARRV